MKSNRWIDISMPLSDRCAKWPTAPATEVTWKKHWDRGDHEANSNLFMNNHTGTHIDAALHFIQGAQSIDQIKPEALMGPAVVVDCGQASQLGAVELERLWPKGAERVLFKTTNSERWRKEGMREFFQDFVALTQDGAQFVASRNPLLVGIDALSIQKFGEHCDTHVHLLSKEIVVVEGLYLADAPAGPCELVCLPLRLEGGEAAPARAVLKAL